MRWYKQVHVQKGRKLKSEEQVKKRLLEIRDNKKSAYHKRLLAGEICVVQHADRYRTTGQYDIVYLVPIEPVGLTSVCGECLETYFTLDDDYLCTKCRELTEP